MRLTVYAYKKNTSLDSIALLYFMNLFFLMIKEFMVS